MFCHPTGWEPAGGDGVRRRACDSNAGSDFDRRPVGRLCHVWATSMPLLGVGRGLLMKAGLGTRASRGRLRKSWRRAGPGITLSRKGRLPAVRYDLSAFHWAGSRTTAQVTRRRSTTERSFVVTPDDGPYWMLKGC